MDKERVCEIINKRGMLILEDLPNSLNQNTVFYCQDKCGYKYRATIRNLLYKKSMPVCHKTNKYSLYNIQLFLDLNDIPFDIISTEYLANDKDLLFKCKRCGSFCKNKWRNINRNRNGKKGVLCCDNCDGTIESYHATVLKQMFLHEYPDTIVEERSCVNPKTGHILPTDIVNHSLKLAIEIQSQWHDYRKDIDETKKDFWIKKGYEFYAPDIRDYSILEMCQIFFDITELPQYINFNKAKKIDLLKAQKLLNSGEPPRRVSEIMDVSLHRIYDAIGQGRLKYPDNYVNNCYCAVVQFDLQGNYLAEYSSISKAEMSVGTSKGNITSCLADKRNYCAGYYWQRKEDYVDKKPLKIHKNP